MVNEEYSEKLKVIEAKRDYIVTDTTFDKCDLCKRFVSKAFNFTPVKKTHNFDNVILCINCLDKCQLLYSIDLQDLLISGSVEAWQKNKN